MVRRKLVLALSALVLGGVASFALLEVALRIYNPIPLPLRGKEIVLPVRKRVVYHNPVKSDKVDRTIEVTRNSLGFRGPEPPRDFDAHLTIVTVGGSTAECRFLSDAKTWPALLAQRLARRFPRVWVNNAGLDGHSTFGHAVLLRQVLAELRPDYVTFLVGVNDVGRAGVTEMDGSINPALQSIRDRVIRESELLTTIQVLYRSMRATNLGLEHLWELDLATQPKAPVVEAEIAREVIEHRRKYIPDYARRLELLVRESRKLGIEPIFITQPVLMAEGNDLATGLPIGPLTTGDGTAALRWRLLSAYNDETRRVGERHGVLVIDAGNAMPKDSRLYYDWMHYSNAGARELARIVAEGLEPWLAARGHESAARATK